MVVGLAAVTPASGFVTPLAALAIGATAAPLSYSAMRFRARRRLDESLDVGACHGMASTWGMAAAGLFATTAVNSDGANGLFFGNPAQLGIQLLAVAVTIAFSFGVTYLLAKLLDLSIGPAGLPMERRSVWTSAPTASGPIHRNRRPFVSEHRKGPWGHGEIETCSRRLKRSFAKTRWATSGTP
jgi:Amt family ammonium transporter